MADDQATHFIHPSAVVAPGATLGPDVRIGPWCSVGPEVVIEAGAELVSHVVVDGITRIGAGAKLYPFCTVGMAPQDLKYRGEATRTELGARSVVRENVTIHRGTVTGTGITRVGEGCLLMAVVHVAHDCEIGNGVVIANNVVMGGHVTIGDNAVIGGGSAIHQFVRIGRCAMVGGLSGVEADIVPFGTVTGNRAKLAGLNVIGLRRRGYDKVQIHALRAAFRQIFAGCGTFAERVEQVRVRAAEDALVVELLAAIDNPGKRGLIRSAVVATDDDDG